MLRVRSRQCLVLALLALGCASPARPIPTERAIFEGRTYAFGRELLKDGSSAAVIEVRRVGLREDLSFLLTLKGRKLSLEALEAGSHVPRAPLASELEEVQALLSPRNPAFSRGLGHWLGTRVDVAYVERALAEELDARRALGEGLIGELSQVYRAERSSAELREREGHRGDTVFAGLFGWQRGAFRGYSWSFPFHLERYDRSEDVRELAIFPFLSGGRSEHTGSEVLVLPLLAYMGAVERPLERSRGFVLLGTGRFSRESLAGTSSMTLLLPLLTLRESSRGEDIAAAPGRIVPGERSSTHIFASLVHVTSERAGIYRDRGGIRSVGHDRSSWRVLPLVSHSSDEHGHETILWPLLGFGWGESDGVRFFRFFYAIKL